jgi:hypothetical protein
MHDGLVGLFRIDMRAMDIWNGNLFVKNNKGQIEYLLLPTSRTVFTTD